MNPYDFLPMAEVFPADVRRWLLEASRIEDPQQRIRAVEEAIRRARLQCPQYFKEEQEP